jgi:hypothetical protein
MSAGNVRPVGDDLTALDDAELDRRIAEVRQSMRPVEENLSALRARRDLMLTERRRRTRLAHRATRADLKAAMSEGKFPTMAELVAGSQSGTLEDFSYHLKTGGEVRLGYPGARAQTLVFTNGALSSDPVTDLAAAARLYEAGWELGSPGRPGVRVHFPGTRQERLVSPVEVFARPKPEPGP